MGPKTETESSMTASQSRKELTLERERLIEIATERFMKEKERQSPLFLCDLAITATEYLRDRETGFDIKDITATWKKPSFQKKSVACIFFSERIFPLFYDATIDEKELDSLVSVFLVTVTTTMSFDICVTLNCAKARKVRDSAPSA